MKALVLGPGLAAHWALGVLLLLGLAAEDWSGAGALVSIAIALVTVILSALCHSPDTRAGGSVARFLATWVALLGHLSAVATAGRALSAALGYIGDGRWLGTFLGARRSGPDVVSFVVAAVPALLCALGLEPSPVLRVLLNTTVAACLVFFVVVGSMHADVSMWTEQGVMASGVPGLLGGAALCSYGFMGLVSPYKGTKGTRVGLGVVLITSHCIVATLLAMLVQYRGLHGSSVPLLQVFEVRDVDWARLVMASCSILALALSVLEISAPLHALLVCLAGDEWRLLPRVLASENNCTGTPLMAILSSGLTASLLAFICPLRLAVRLTCICPLIQNCLMASEAIYNQYRPPGDNITIQSSAAIGKYKRLNKKKGSWSPENRHQLHSATVTCLKSGLSLALGNSRRSAIADSRSASNGTIATCLLSGSTPSLQGVSINSDGFDSSIISNGSVVKVLNENQIEIGSYTYKKSPSTIHLNSLYSNGYVDSKNIINGVLSENNKHINSHINVSTNASIVPNKPYIKSIIAQDGVTQTFIDMNSPERTRFSNNLNMQKSPGNSENKVFNLANHDEGGHNVRIVDIQNSEDRLAYCKERFPMDLSQSEDEELSSTDAESDNSCSSSTDIDAIVAEYKEQLKVATTTPSATSVHEQVATAATCRRVLFCLFALPFLLATFGTGCVISAPASIWCICASVLGITILFCLIAKQPPAATVTQTVPWIPWLPMMCMIMCTAIGSQIMEIVWPGVLLWISAGLILYCWRKQLCQRGSRSSRRERIRLHAPPRHATISTLVPSHRHLHNDQARRLTCVDTILISR